MPAIYIRDIGEIEVQGEVNQKSDNIRHPHPGTETLLGDRVHRRIESELALHVVHPTLAYQELLHIKQENEQCSSQFHVLEPIVGPDHGRLVVIDTKQTNDREDQSRRPYVNLNTIRVRVVPTTLKAYIANEDAEDTDEGVHEVEKTQKAHAKSERYT